VGITINFRRIKTEKSRGSHEAGCTASNVDEVYDLAIFLPGPRRESHPASDLQKRLVRINSGVDGRT